jgi:hypothetical protein
VRSRSSNKTDSSSALLQASCSFWLIGRPFSGSKREFLCRRRDATANPLRHRAALPLSRLWTMLRDKNPPHWSSVHFPCMYEPLSDGHEADLPQLAQAPASQCHCSNEQTYSRVITENGSPRKSRLQYLWYVQVHGSSLLQGRLFRSVRLPMYATSRDIVRLVVAHNSFGTTKTICRSSACTTLQSCADISLHCTLSAAPQARISPRALSATGRCYLNTCEATLEYNPYISPLPTVPGRRLLSPNHAQFFVAQRVLF